MLIESCGKKPYDRILLLLVYDAHVQLPDISRFPEALRLPFSDGGSAPDPICQADGLMIGALDEKHKKGCKFDAKNDKSKSLLVGHIHSKLRRSRHAIE